MLLKTNSSQDYQPAYLKLLESGELAQRKDQAAQHLSNCDLCARYCHVNRYQTTKGAVCRTGEKAVVYSFGPHHGEEKPLRGDHGSGTIFFSWCNLRCVYCQNWEISQLGQGNLLTPEELAQMMLQLQERGCHNINFVSPSHVVAQIIEAVNLAARRGLHLPLVYNTGGYDSPEALKLLGGIIDIYMPDLKYGDEATALKYSKAPNYVQVNQQAVKEMHRQVGDLVIAANGLAVRGLLVRHLVLPNNLAGTEQVLSFLVGEISRHTYLNLMAQYYPCRSAEQHPPLDRPLTSREYQQARQLADKYGCQRLAS